MAKKKFNVTSTLNKNKPTLNEPELAPKISLKKTNKDLDAVKEKVEEIHQGTPPLKDTIAEPPKATAPVSRTRTKKAAKTIEPKSEKLVRLTIDTPAEMHTQLKIKAVLSGISMRDYILRLLERELKKG